MRKLASVLIASAAILAGCQPDPPHAAADLVILEGDLRPMDPAIKSATALAVRDGLIAYVGTDTEAAQWIGPDTQVIHAEGHTVLPGFIDSHIHAAGSALARNHCSLNDEQYTVEEAGAKIKPCLANDNASKLLVVIGVNGAGFKANRKQLDEIVRDRPLIFWGSDGHTAWANTRALELAGITRATLNPPDGRIERDSTGDATGFLVDGAVGLVLDFMDKPSPAKRLEALVNVLPELHLAGITSYLEANTDAETVAAYAELARLKLLTARVTIALESNGADTVMEFERLRALRAQVAGNPLLRADFIKLFADGVMEFPTQTAAMLAPYNLADGKPGTSKGRLYLEPSAMSAFIKHANAEGFNVHVHAIGDAAVRETLNAFAAARAAGSQRLYSIAHLQLVDPADIPRFAALNVLASAQLLWAQPDNYSIDSVKPYLGDERLAHLYPARSLIARGATIAGGSDWDVSSFSPFEAIATGMSRINPKERERGALNINEVLTLDEMLAAYTINAARLIGRDAEIGSLTVGKAADIIVLDLTLGPKTTADDVRKARPSHTFFAGKRVPEQPTGAR